MSFSASWSMLVFSFYFDLGDNFRPFLHVQYLISRFFDFEPRVKRFQEVKDLPRQFLYRNYRGQVCRVHLDNIDRDGFYYKSVVPPVDLQLGSIDDVKLKIAMGEEIEKIQYLQSTGRLTPDFVLGLMYRMTADRSEGTAYWAPPEKRAEAKKLYMNRVYNIVYDLTGHHRPAEEEGTIRNTAINGLALLDGPVTEADVERITLSAAEAILAGEFKLFYSGYVKAKTGQNAVSSPGVKAFEPIKLIKPTGYVGPSDQPTAP